MWDPATCRMVPGACSSHSECNQGPPCHLWWGKRKKKRATTQTSLDRFFERGDRTESSKEVEPLLSTSSVVGVSEIAACPPSPTVDDPSALPSPTISSSSSQCLFSPVQSMPAPVCQLLYWLLYVSRYCTLYCKIKNVFFFLCITCVKSIISLLKLIV